MQLDILRNDGPGLRFVLRFNLCIDMSLPCWRSEMFTQCLCKYHVLSLLILIYRVMTRMAALDICPASLFRPEPSPHSHSLPRSVSPLSRASLHAKVYAHDGPVYDIQYDLASGIVATSDASEQDRRETAVVRFARIPHIFASASISMGEGACVRESRLRAVRRASEGHRGRRAQLWEAASAAVSSRRVHPLPAPQARGVFARRYRLCVLDRSARRELSKGRRPFWPFSLLRMHAAPFWLGVI